MQARAFDLLTIGHSKHPIDRFLDLLRDQDVAVLVDVRSQPASRFSPQFNRKRLEQALAGASIRYLFMGDSLGGRPQDPACYRADGKLDYDLVEAQDFYRRGIERLIEVAARLRVCILCAEENPSHCHRRLLVTRTLSRQGFEVTHIRGDGTVERDSDLEPHRKDHQLPLL